MKQAVRLLLITLALTAMSTAGVTVSSPANNSTVGSPVHVVASASSTKPITAMRIYVDNVSVYLISAGKIDTSVVMSAARHNVVVQAWDSAGNVFKTAVLITTTTAPSPTPTPKPSPSPSPTPTPSPTPVPLPVPPSTAVTKANIEQMTGWANCTTCAGAGGNGPTATFSMTQNQASPSLDGNSTKFSIAGTTPYSDALWWKQLGAVNTATNFKYDVYFYITQPQRAQALEFDVNQANGAHRWIFGTQCAPKSGVWDVWANANGKWTSTGIPCSPPTAFVWHHLTWEYKRTATQLTFIGFTYDGVTHFVNKTYTANPSTVNELNVAFQMDGDSKMEAYSTWLDKVSLTYW